MIGTRASGDPACAVDARVTEVMARSSQRKLIQASSAPMSTPAPTRSENRKPAPTDAIPPTIRVNRAIRRSVNSYCAAPAVSISLPAKHAAKHRAHPRKNPLRQESTSGQVSCAATGRGDTQIARPQQSRTPAQSAIPKLLHTGWRQNQAVFGAMGREASLVPQWPLKPVGKNSE